MPGPHEVEKTVVPEKPMYLVQATWPGRIQPQLRQWQGRVFKN